MGLKKSVFAEEEYNERNACWTENSFILWQPEHFKVNSRKRPHQLSVAATVFDGALQPATSTLFAGALYIGDSNNQII